MAFAASLRLKDILSSIDRRQIWYVPLLVLSMGGMLARIFILARLFNVTTFSIYNGGLLVSSGFLMLGCLGMQSLLQRELPMLIVRQDEYSGAVLALQCVIVALICAAIAVGSIMGFGIGLAGLAPEFMSLALVHGLSLQLFGLATVDSRSRGEPLRYALENLYRTLIILCVSITAAIVFNDASTVLAGEAGSSIIMAIWLFNKNFRTASVSFVFTLRQAWRGLPSVSWHAAFVLLFVSFSSYLLINGDRWLAAQILSPISFGHYAFAWTILMAAQSAQLVINTSLFPFLARSFARLGGRSAYYKCVSASLGLLIIGAVLALPMWAVLDGIISNWFVAYNEVRSLLPLFLFVAVFRLSDFWTSYLIVIGRERKVLQFNILGVILATIVWGLTLLPTLEISDIGQIGRWVLLAALFGYVMMAWEAWRCSRQF